MFISLKSMPFFHMHLVLSDFRCPSAGLGYLSPDLALLILHCSFLGWKALPCSQEFHRACLPLASQVFLCAILGDSCQLAPNIAQCIFHREIVMLTETTHYTVLFLSKPSWTMLCAVSVDSYVNGILDCALQSFNCQSPSLFETKLRNFPKQSTKCVACQSSSCFWFLTDFYLP